MAVMKLLVVPNGLGNATPDKVLQGSTFTSDTGVLQEGTAEKGIDTSDATAVSGNVIEGKTFYNADGKQTGTLKDNIIASKEMINVSAYAQSGLYGSPPENARYSTTSTLTVSNANIARALSITPEKIAPNNTIAGVSGTYGSDATATASDIASGKVAYNNDGRVVGTAKIEVSETFLSPTTPRNIGITIEGRMEIPQSSGERYTSTTSGTQYLQRYHYLYSLIGNPIAFKIGNNNKINFSLVNNKGVADSSYQAFEQNAYFFVSNNTLYICDKGLGIPITLYY